MKQCGEGRIINARSRVDRYEVEAVVAERTLGRQASSGEVEMSGHVVSVKGTNREYSSNVFRLSL